MVNPSSRAAASEAAMPIARGPSRGFTIVEVMVAIVLALSLAAVVLPVAMSWVPAAGLDEAGARVESALALARADAQRRGVVLEVVAVAAAGGEIELRSREIEPDEEEGASAEVGAQEADWTLLTELPRGIVLKVGAAADAEEQWGESGPDGSDAATEAVVVAIVLPDGRIIGATGAGESGAAGLRAVGAEGRWVGLAVNGWSGAVTATPGVAGREGDDEEGEPREDPAEEP